VRREQQKKLNTELVGTVQKYAWEGSITIWYKCQGVFSPWPHYC
jgi:hypothetical protein